MTDTATDEQVLAVLRPSPPRRVIGVAILGLLGFMLIWFGFQHPTDPILFSVILIAMGSVSIWLAWRMWVATSGSLILTDRVLKEEGGRILARVDDMRAIDRGVFAVKPAGGFTVVTASSEARSWAPGLWWRLGRRVGIGGVTHRHEGRYMAEVLAEVISARKAR